MYKQFIKNTNHQISSFFFYLFALIFKKDKMRITFVLAAHFDHLSDTLLQSLPNQVAMAKPQKLTKNHWTETKLETYSFFWVIVRI